MQTCLFTPLPPRYLFFLLIVSIVSNIRFTCFQVRARLVPKRCQSRAFARNLQWKPAVAVHRHGLAGKSVQNYCRAKNTSAKLFVILVFAHLARKRALKTVYVALRKKKDPATLLNFSVTRYLTSHPPICYAIFILVSSRSVEKCWIVVITDVKLSVTLGNAQPVP